MRAFRILKFLPAFAYSFLALASRLSAQVVWNGGGSDNNWSTGANWVGGIAPANDSTASIQFSGSTRNTPVADASWSIVNLTFDSSATAFSLSGNPLTFSASGATIANTNTTPSGNIATISNNLAIQGPTTFDSTGGLLRLLGGISGTGSLLVKTPASNTMNVGGDLTHTGGTTIDTGSSLVIGLGSTAGSISGNVAINGDGLIFNRSNTITFSGATSGAGVLAQSGNGTLILTGANTHTGGTWVNFGELRIGNGGTTGSVTGNITDNGIVRFMRSDDVTFPGVVSGSGQLYKDGTGTLTLTGLNTNSGGVWVNTGTLSIGVDNALSTSATLGVSILSGATLDVAHNQTVNEMTGFGYVTVGSNMTLTLSNGTNLGAFSGTLSGSGTTVVSGGTFGTGTGASLNGGTLQIGAGSTTGALSGNLTNNASVVFDSTANQVYSGVISGTGSLVKQGSGGLFLTGVNTYAGGTTISAGVINVGNGGATGSIAGDVTNNGQLTFSRTGTLTYGGVISGTGSVVISGGVTGNGTTTFTGLNTFTGGTLISTGTLVVGAVNTLPTGSAVTVSSGAKLDVQNDQSIGNLFSAGTVALSSGIKLTSTPTSGVTFSGVFSGDGSYIKAGIQSVTLTGNSTFTGGTTVTGGLINFNSAVNFGTGTVTLNGGGLQWATGTATDISDRLAAIGSSGATFNTNGNSVSFASALTGTGGVTKSGSGTLTLSSAGSFSGATTVSTGTLAVGVDNALPSGTAVSIASGTNLDVQNNQTVGSLSGAGNVALASGKLLTVAGSSTTTASGVISGAGAFAKSGSGTLTLSGINTYSGNTTVTGGILSISVDSGLGTAPASATAGSLTLDGGALNIRTNFALDSNRGITLGSSGGSFQINSGTTLSYGGIITGTGGLSKASSGTLTLSGTNTYTGSTTVSAGTLAISADVNLGAAPGSVTAGSLTLNGGALEATSSFTLNANRGVALGGSGGNFIADAGQTFTYVGIVAGSGALTKSGNGWLALSGTNTFTGATTINAGTLIIGADAGLGAAPSSATPNKIVLNGGILRSTNTITLAANRGITLGTSGGTIDVFFSGNTVSYGGIVAGAGNLTKIGAGTLMLSGINTFTGLTTVNAGTLALSADSGLGAAPASAAPGQITFNGGSLQSTSTLTLNANRGISLGASGGTFTPDVATTLTVAGVIAGAGGLTKSGFGVVSLTGVNTYTGPTSLPLGILAIAADSGLGTAPATATAGQIAFDGGTLSATANLTLDPNRGVSFTTNGGNFLVNTSAVMNYGGIAAGAGGLTKTGAGTLTLSGANSFTGATALSGGTLAIGATNSLPTSTALTTAAGTNLDVQNSQAIASLAATGAVAIATGQTLTVSGSTSTTSSGIFSGAGALTKAGTSTLTLTGASTFTGDTTINGGTLQFGSGSTTGTAASSAHFVTGASGTLAFNHSDNLSVTNLITGTGSLVQTGTGILTLTRTNSFSGTTTISSGTLRLGSGASGGSTGIVAGDIINNASLIFNRSTAQTFTPVISGTGTVSQTGTGAFTLSANNTYSGATTVSAGTLVINGALPNSAVTVAIGATLGGSGTLGSSATFQSGSHLAPGNSPGTLTFTNGLSLLSGAILDFELGSASDKIVVSGGTLAGPASGTVTINLSDAGGFGPGTYTLFDFTNASPSNFGPSSFGLGTLPGGTTGDYLFSIVGSTLTLTTTASAIPEPSATGLLSAIGTLVVVSYLRRRPGRALAGDSFHP